MRILLITPKEEKLRWLNKYPTVHYAPLNLQILASLTPNEEVKIVDENFDDVDFDEDYDLVGITLHSSSNIMRTKELYEEFKKRNMPVVIGGPPLSSTPIKDLLKCADSIVLGEGEGAWERVVKDVKNNKLKRIYQNKELVDLSKLETLPRRDLTKNKDYLVHRIEIARGCIHNCDYCTIVKFNRGKYRTYKIERIIREVEQCLDYPAQIKKAIYFADSNIAVKPHYKIELFRKLIPYNIAWFVQSDISIAKNEKLLGVLAKSGCLELHIGFESVNQDSLDSVNKLVNRVSEYKKAVKTLHDYGICVYGFFMLGLDGDKPGVAKKTLDFISEAGIDFATAFIATPNYGTGFFERVKKEGRLLTKDQPKYNREYAVFQPKNMTPEQLEEEHKWFVNHANPPYLGNVFNLAKRVLVKKQILNRNVKFSTKLSVLSNYVCYNGIYYRIIRKMHRKLLRLLKRVK